MGESKRRPVTKPVRRRRWLAGAAAVLALVAALVVAGLWWWPADTQPVAAPTEGGSAAATVNGTAIAASVVDAEAAVLVRSKPNQARAAEQRTELTAPGGKPTAALRADTTGQLVLARLVETEAGRRRLAVTDFQRSLVGPALEAEYSPPVWASFPDWYRRSLTERRARLDLLTTNEAGLGVDEPALRAFYQKNGGRYGTTCIRQILWGVGDPEAAQKANVGHQQLTQGADFAAMAQAESTEDSGKRGGQLGCLTQAQLDDIDPTFPPTINPVAAGAFTKPFQTRYGWHIVKVDERKTQPFEAVRTQVYADAVHDAGPAGTKLLGALVTAATVTVDPAYGVWARQRNGAWWVTPAKAP